MKKIPEDVQLLIDGYGDREKFIYEDDFFIVVKDPKHCDSEYFYYTAWCKEDLRSILDLERKHIPFIYFLKNALKTEYHITNKNSRQLIHFPPNFWRLHIHFISNKLHKNIRCYAPHTHYLCIVLANIRSCEEHYRDRAIIQR